MKILICNDDGWQSEGIQVLKQTLSFDHDVWILAPEEDRSGFSHSFTLNKPQTIRSRAHQVYSCSGTPVDCAIYGLGGFFNHQFDLVLSGINHGANLGTDLYYSGTAGVARQACIKNVPSIALSIEGNKGPHNFKAAALFLKNHLQDLLNNWDSSFFYNINFPRKVKENHDSAFSFPGKRLYNDSLLKIPSPHSGDTFCILKGELVANKDEPGSDIDLISKNIISISKVKIEIGASVPSRE